MGPCFTRDFLAIFGERYGVLSHGGKGMVRIIEEKVGGYFLSKLINVAGKAVRLRRGDEG